MKDQTKLAMNTHNAQLDQDAAKRSTSNKKNYRAPQLRRLGDFHSMTRTGQLVPLFQDLMTNDIYIS